MSFEHLTIPERSEIYKLRVTDKLSMSEIGRRMNRAKTMTFDNRREFCGHEKLSESLKIKAFFANPYHSWERGLNEHTTNGLIREFHPKSTKFKIEREEDFQRAVDFINHRPRKSLDYRTPYEVFFASSEPATFQV